MTVDSRRIMAGFKRKIGPLKLHHQIRLLFSAVKIFSVKLNINQNKIDHDIFLNVMENLIMIVKLIMMVKMITSKETK